jgi:type II secretory pathway pseudopilin PulG
MGANVRRGRLGGGIARLSGSSSRSSGYTIIEVMLFFAVTGGLMLAVLGSASVGVNTQRYNDALNTFTAIVQQEFTNATNVVNTRSVPAGCGGALVDDQPRGISNCFIIGRLMNIDRNGTITKSNLVGREPGAVDSDISELELIRDYAPTIDTRSSEADSMSWDTAIERGSPAARTSVSVLMLRSPRSGNVYSYVVKLPENPISSDEQLTTTIGNLIGESPRRNSIDQYLCVDRSGWVLTPSRAVKIAPYSSGPSGVSVVETEGVSCD